MFQIWQMRVQILILVTVMHGGSEANQDMEAPINDNTFWLRHFYFAFIISYNNKKHKTFFVILKKQSKFVNRKCRLIFCFAEPPILPSSETWRRRQLVYHEDGSHTFV
jgi:hypothetical protein